MVGVLGQIRLTHDGDALARAGDPATIQCLNVVDGGEVVRRKKVLPGNLRGEMRMHDDARGLGRKSLSAVIPRATPRKALGSDGSLVLA